MQPKSTFLNIRLHPDDYLGLTFEKYLSHQRINEAQACFLTWTRTYKSDPNLLEACHFMQKNLRKHVKFPAYLITPAALAQMVKEDMDLDLLRKGLTEAGFNATYLLSKEEFLRFSVRGEAVAGWAVRQTITAQGKKGLKAIEFNIDLFEDYTGEMETHGDTLASDFQNLLLRIISFVEFGSGSVSFLDGPTDVSNAGGGPTSVPQEPSSFHVVGADWNTTTIRTAPSAVRGHYRNQPCGKQLQSIKKVWIADHSRSGYQRKAGKVRSAAHVSHPLPGGGALMLFPPLSDN